MGRRFSKALDVSLEEQDDDSTVVSLHNDGAHVFACRPLHWHSVQHVGSVASFPFAIIFSAKEGHSSLVHITSLSGSVLPGSRLSQVQSESEPEGFGVSPPLDSTFSLATLTVLYPVQEVDRATLRA